MLYEVITASTKKVAPKIVSGRVVNTVIDFFVSETASRPNGAAEVSSSEESTTENTTSAPTDLPIQFRITSYNVCYTKLLRKEAQRRLRKKMRMMRRD